MRTGFGAVSSVHLNLLSMSIFLLAHIVTQQAQTHKRHSPYASFVRPPLLKKYWNAIPPAKHIKFVFGLPRSTKKKDTLKGASR